MLLLPLLLLLLEEKELLLLVLGLHALLVPSVAAEVRLVSECAKVAKRVA